MVAEPLPQALLATRSSTNVNNSAARIIGKREADTLASEFE